jgi:hypothetical protein
MATRLRLNILPQPDDTVCGPTCLHAIYRFFGDELSLGDIIRQTPRLDEGGTLSVMLACHALDRGYQADMYTFNLRVFDPTWFRLSPTEISAKLEAQMAVKSGEKLQLACRAYQQFISKGGRVHMEDLTVSLIRRYLVRDIPILTGLSSTYLYGDAREIGRTCQADDVRGEAAGHFVVLCGYDRVQRRVLVADPYLPNPLGEGHYYEVTLERLVCAILLGVLTYDANLLILRPRGRNLPPEELAKGVEVESGSQA